MVFHPIRGALGAPVRGRVPPARVLILVIYVISPWKNLEMFTIEKYGKNMVMFNEE